MFPKTGHIYSLPPPKQNIQSNTLRVSLITNYTNIYKTRKWFPLKGKLAPLYFLINNEPILIRSMLAAGIVQDTFAGEAVEGEGSEEETTGGYFSTAISTGTFTAQARKSSIS